MGGVKRPAVKGDTYPCLGCKEWVRFQALRAGGLCKACSKLAAEPKPGAPTHGTYGDETHSEDVDLEAKAFSERVREEAGR